METTPPLDAPNIVQPVSSTSQNDLYDSFIPGHLGQFSKQQVIPTGFDDSQISSFDKIVLKPDGDFFKPSYCNIATGTTKGDTTQVATNLLRHLMTTFHKAEIRASGGTDASFHVILTVDKDVSDLFISDRTTFDHILTGLRLISFCDRVGDSSILSGLSARAIGSTHSVSKKTVTQDFNGSGVYSVAELQSLLEAWNANPAVSLTCSWFGVSASAKYRCPFHDSKATDAEFGALDEYGVVKCWGSLHCAKNGVAVFPMIETNKKRPSIIDLIIGHKVYGDKWKKTYKEYRKVVVDLKNHQNRAARKQASGKDTIVISAETLDDDLVERVNAILLGSGQVYQGTDGVFITLQNHNVDGRVMMQRHDTQDKFIALVSRYAGVEKEMGKQIFHGSLPADRARIIYNRPDTRRNLPVIDRVSRTPVLDVKNACVQKPGYDPNTRVFYDGPVIQARSDGLTPHTDILLSGWTGMCGSAHRTCSKDRDIAHMYAAVASEVLADARLFSLKRHPLLKGNQKGVGKDKFCHCLGVLRDEKEPVDLMHDDDNRINQHFGNEIQEGRNVFQFTNIKVGNGIYNNTLVVKWSTMEAINGAKHGGGKWERNPNTVTFIFTLNEGSIDNDLLDRLLPIMLVGEGDARERDFPFIPKDYATAHRLEIIGEWFGLAIQMLKQGLKWKIPKGIDQRFREWMEVVGAILDLRGIRGFMTDMDEVESEIDEMHEQFTELARRVFNTVKNKELKAKELVEYCDVSHGGKLFEGTLSGKKQPERALATFVLLRHINKKVNLTTEEGVAPKFVQLEKRLDSTDKTNKYRFELVGSQLGSSGGDGGETGVEIKSPPQAFSWEKPVSSGGNGGEFFELNSIKNSRGEYSSNDSNIIPPPLYVYGRVPENTPFTPVTPANVSDENPWGGQ